MSDVNTNVPLSFARSQVRIYFKQYKEYLSNASQKRQDFQDELAQARAIEGKTSIVREVQRMKRVELQRESAKRIRRMNGTMRTSKGLSKVVVTDENGVDNEIVDKTNMEIALLDAYEKTLTQSNNTPCMQSPLKERIGLSANTQTAFNILEGNSYNDVGIDDITKEVLRYLEMKEGSSNMFTPKPLNVPECKLGWGKMKERTSSSIETDAISVTGSLDIQTMRLR